MSCQYFGWVPTVTGNLSFSIIGTGRNPKKLLKNYQTDSDKKFTIAALVRNTSDRVGFKSGRIKKYVFIYFAISFLSEKHFYNHGMVFIIPWQEYWRYRYLTEPLRGNNTTNNCIRKNFETTFRALQTKHAKRHVVCVRTTLDRKGQLTIDSSENGFQEDAEGTVANQVYYFIRDIAHTHQHHEPSSDTILKAYPDENLRNHGNSNWKRETLYALHKFIIQQKRGRRYESLVRCQGVLAYAKAFLDLHVQGKDDVPIYLEEPLRRSLESSASEMKTFIPKSIPDLLYSIILPFFSFLIAYLVFANNTVLSGSGWQIDLLRYISGWIKRNPVATIFLPFLPCVVMWLSRHVKAKVFPLLRSTQRLLLSFGYYKSIALIGAFFGLISLRTLFLFFVIFP